MSKTLEIEFKNMLAQNEYTMLLNEFNIKPNDLFLQENHYFDTPQFALKELESALRIREKNNQYEFTLKQPAKIGLLETTQIITEVEFIDATKHNQLPEGIVIDSIIEMGIAAAAIEFFGTLKTKRVEISYAGGLLVFDHSFYLNKEDYELEFETDDDTKGLEIFQQFLKQYKIPERNTENKIRRFYREKYLQKKP